jgi:radical SAM modification target selenobiotic family peptide
MDIQELKKHLARLGIVGLLAGAGLSLTATAGTNKSG